MVHYLPSSSFTTVDVRHTPVDAYRLVSYARLAMLGAQGVGGVLAYGKHDHLIQCHLPTGERLGCLLPGDPNLLPSDLRTGAWRRRPSCATRSPPSASYHHRACCLVPRRSVPRPGEPHPLLPLGVSSFPL